MLQDTLPSSHYEQTIDCSSANLETLSSYELRVDEFIHNTPLEITEDTKKWIRQALSFLPSNADILEIGSGFGKDAHYIESLGFSVERTDATHAFVDFLRDLGYAAHSFNPLTEDFSKQYDFIFANSVFLHFTPQDLQHVLKKTHQALKKEGVLAFSLKKGKGEEWTNVKIGLPRYFCYWTPHDLLSLLESEKWSVLSFSDEGLFLLVIAKPIKEQTMDTP